MCSIGVGGVGVIVPGPVVGRLSHTGLLKHGGIIGDAELIEPGQYVGTAGLIGDEDDAAVAHTFSLASSAAGPGAYGPAAVIIGLVILVIIGLTMRETRSA